jgi:hypothetical protein
MLKIAACIDHYYHNPKDFEKWGKITIFAKAFFLRNMRRFFRNKEVKNGINLEIIDSLRILILILTICFHIFLNGRLAIPTTMCKSIKSFHII